MYEDTAYEDEMPTDERLREIAKLWDDMSKAKKKCVLKLLENDIAKVRFLDADVKNVRERKNSKEGEKHG